jgi:hypothetical protein
VWCEEEVEVCELYTIELRLLRGERMVVDKEAGENVWERRLSSAKKHD